MQIVVVFLLIGVCCMGGAACVDWIAPIVKPCCVCCFRVCGPLACSALSATCSALRAVVDCVRAWIARKVATRKTAPAEQTTPRPRGRSGGGVTKIKPAPTPTRRQGGGAAFCRLATDDDDDNDLDAEMGHDPDALPSNALTLVSHGDGKVRPARGSSGDVYGESTSAGVASGAMRFGGRSNSTALAAVPETLNAAWMPWAQQQERGLPRRPDACAAAATCTFGGRRKK